MDKNSLGGIILAGGFGSRLSPLTDTVPKPLLKVLGKSVLDTAIEKLSDLQVEDIAVSCHCKAQMVSSHISGMKNVRSVYEAVPMGTAGGAKLCVGKDLDNIIVLSGDGVFDFDIAHIVRYHIESGADVTIVTTLSENPTELGVVVADDNGNVSEILEKPCWNRVVSDVVNTGIYVLKRRVFDEIPDNVPYDFSRDLFPKLLKNGSKVKSLTLTDYWCDIGTPGEYLKCNIDGCMGKIKSLTGTKDDMKNLRSVGIQAKDAVFLGEEASFGSNVVLDGGFVSGKKCHVGKNCIICHSVLSDCVSVGEGCGIYGSVLGNGVTVEDNCIIPEGCVIADGCVIKEGTVLTKNTSVNAKGEMMSRMDGHKSEAVFEKDGTALLKRQNIYAAAERFGYCLAMSLKGDSDMTVQIGVVCQNGEKKVCDSFVKGCIKAGADIFHLMDCDASLVKFASSVFPCDVTVCLKDLGEDVEIEMYRENMQKLEDFYERKVMKLYNSVSVPENDDTQECAGKITLQNIAGIYRMYATKAVKLMLGNLPSPVCIPVFENKTTLKEKILGALFEKMCRDEKQRTEYKAVFDGDCFEIRDTNKVYDCNHILAAVLSYSDVLGMDGVYVNEDVPEAVKYLLIKKNIPFDNLSDYEVNKEFGCEMSRLVCLEEGMSLCALMCLLTLKGMRLNELMDTLPDFEIYTDIYIGSRNRAGTMARLCKMYGIGDRKKRGVTVKLSGGNVTVIPERVIGFKVISEAASMETAKELCKRIEKAVLNEKQ